MKDETLHNLWIVYETKVGASPKRASAQCNGMSMTYYLTDFLSMKSTLTNVQMLQKTGKTSIRS